MTIDVGISIADQFGKYEPYAHVVWKRCPCVGETVILSIGVFTVVDVVTAHHFTRDGDTVTVRLSAIALHKILLDECCREVRGAKSKLR